MMESEIQSLQSNVSRLREEASSMVFGLIAGGMGSGYFVEWYFHVQHIRPTETMIPLIVGGCTLVSLLTVVTFTAMVRLRFFLRWKRAKKARLDEQFVSLRRK